MHIFFGYHASFARLTLSALEADREMQSDIDVQTGSGGVIAFGPLGDLAGRTDTAAQLAGYVVPEFVRYLSREPSHGGPR